jgi:putative aldouronate transport system permease protein
MGNKVQQKVKTKNKALLFLSKNYVLYLLLLPTLVYFAIFHVIPIIGMRLAFYDYRIVGDNVWVGFKNFEKLFSTPQFRKILSNTLIISAMKIFLFFPLPILFAIILNEFRVGFFRKSIQVVSYLPHFLSWVVIAGIWIDYLSPSSGFLQSMGKLFNSDTKNLLTDKGAIRWILLASETWRSIGWDSIIYLSVILSIDTHLFEAAKIDGASSLQGIRYITLPALTDTMITVLILNIGFFLSAGLDQVLNFTNMAVNSKIDILDTYVYRIGLGSGQYSLATAASLFKGVVGAILILSTNKIVNRFTGKGAW